MTQQAIQQRPPEAYITLREFLTKPQVAAQIGEAMPRGKDATRLIRQFLTLVLQDKAGPGLLKCSHLSIGLGLMRAAELGLEMSGPLGHCYLIPRAGKATFQIGYRGLLALAWRSGQVRSIAPRIVRARDVFRVHLGTSPHLVHVPDDSDDPGEITHFYAAVEFVNGGSDFEVWRRSEMEAHRDRYVQAKGPGTPWADHYQPMAQKTTLIHLCKRLPLCAEAQQVAIEDEHEEAGVLAERRDVPGLREHTRGEEVLSHLLGAGEGAEPGPEDAPAG